jgi:dephospho-CoA kinase
MKIIGLTGGIGSGKSTAAKFLAELGAEVIDLDKAGHEALSKSGGAYKKAIREFGEAILDEDGNINRAKLGRIVFEDPRALKRLNSITHPVIDKAVAAKIKECRGRGVKVVVLEAAALLDAGKARQADEIWVTTANEETILKRLKERSGYSEAEAKDRIHSQMTDEERIKKADIVIDTNCTLDELKTRVKAEWDKLLKRL